MVVDVLLCKRNQLTLAIDLHVGYDRVECNGLGVVENPMSGGGQFGIFDLNQASGLFAVVEEL